MCPYANLQLFMCVRICRDLHADTLSLGQTEMRVGQFAATRCYMWHFKQEVNKIKVLS